MIDNQIERLIRGSLGLLEPVPRLSLPAGLERILASRTIIGAQDGSSSDEINGDGSRLSATRSFKRSSQPSLPVPISAARTSSSIAATVSASAFGNRAAVRNPQHSGANRAQNPDHSAATASASTSAPRRTAWRTPTASACKLTNRARLRACVVGSVPSPSRPPYPGGAYNMPARFRQEQSNSAPHGLACRRERNGSENWGVKKQWHKNPPS
jgi:hypothetical protein